MSLVRVLADHLDWTAARDALTLDVSARWKRVLSVQLSASR